MVFVGGEGEIDSGHPGPRAARAVAKALRRPKSLPAILSNSLSGGEGGIRTHGRIAPTPVFKTGAFNRSATSPAGVAGAILPDKIWLCAGAKPLNGGHLALYWPEAAKSAPRGGAKMAAEAYGGHDGHFPW